MNFTSVTSSPLPRKIEINASTSQNVHMNATMNVDASCTCTFTQLPDAVAIIVVPELDLPALCARHQPARETRQCNARWKLCVVGGVTCAHRSLCPWLISHSVPRTQTQTDRSQCPTLSQPARVENKYNVHVPYMYHTCTCTPYAEHPPFLTPLSHAVTAWSKHLEWHTAATGWVWVCTMSFLRPAAMASFKTARWSLPSSTQCDTGLT